MLKISVKNKLSYDKKLNESIGFISNKILDGCKEKNIIVGFTSSIDNRSHDLVMEKVIDFVSQNLQNYNKSVSLVKEDFDKKNIYEIHDKLTDSKNKNKITLVKARSVNIYSNTVEILKCCDMIISVEQYGKSRYLNFEEMLEFLRGNCLKINGVIACR